MRLLLCLLPMLLILPTMAQPAKFDPPAAKTPDAATLKAIADKTAILAAKVKALPARSKLLPDVEVCLKAAEWIVRHGEWFTANSGKQTLDVLDLGIARADLLAAGKHPWTEPKGQVLRGYRSSVDGSVQPYAVIWPTGFDPLKKKAYRLDLVLHGRDSSLTEVKFIAGHGPNKKVDPAQEAVVVEIYGRGNNAYRWAGETDIAEVLPKIFEGDWFQGHPIDPRRIVVRGFSMGGAGTWHLGLHHPGSFAAMAPGAGFTNTHGYIKGMPDPLPPHQEACLTIYDAVRYAENAKMIPIVAYSGEKDPQKAAADNIEKRLKELKIPGMVHLIAPGLEHQFPAEWQKKVEAELVKHAGPGTTRAPRDDIDFTTYTLIYPDGDWIGIRGLKKHYERANVKSVRKGDSLELTTINITHLLLMFGERDWKPKELSIDGRKLDPAVFADQNPYLRLGKGGWEKGAEDRMEVRKNERTMGPIDDAFRAEFVCVGPSQPGWHPKTDALAKAQFSRFAADWDKWMRGKLPTRLPNANSGSGHQILFGDPESNPAIADFLPKLPIRWTATELVVDGKTYDASGHLPVLIYPNPSDPTKYIVLNSGHTFGEADFKGTNALLYPRLGDYAVIEPSADARLPGYKAVHAGLFDERWAFPKR